MKKQIPEGLQELDASLKRLEAALAWQDLRQMEYRPNDMFPPPGDMSLDAKLELSRFWSIAFDIADSFKEASRSAQRKDRPQYQKLIQRCRQLVVAHNL